MLSSEIERVRDLYLSTIVRVLANTIYEDGSVDIRGQKEFAADQREIGADWPAVAFTMIGVQRLTNLRTLTERVLLDGVPGDLIETGVWRGGACILMRAVLAAYGDRERVVICADSFAGLPTPEPSKFPADLGDLHHQFPQLAVPRPQVENAFARFGLLDDQVQMLEGWFEDTLPKIRERKFALLRLDGDMYGSTWEALNNLYPALAPGGYVIVDDYGAVPGCRKAVDDYRAKHSIREPLNEIDWTGVWWRK